ncbi:MAG: pyruvate:ferredoxin (flavodoxin) oxidoreductase, partial [Holophagales bacterium]|nr:pyruvate:ferredoxin (flavodoxin) oxidoreductase [Holophagales bacterium]
SNTGGQASKATPLGAAAKFATAGKELGKKDLGLEVMSYGHVYVARIAFGAQINQAVKALREAESYPGPSLVIAYSHCVAHGYDLVHGLEQQKRAVSSWVWPLYRFDPRRAAAGDPALVIDSGKPESRVRDYMRAEARFRMVERLDAERFEGFAERAQDEAERRYHRYLRLAGANREELSNEDPVFGEGVRP